MTIIGDNHDIGVILGTGPIGEDDVVFATTRPETDGPSIQLIIDPLVSIP